MKYDAPDEAFPLRAPIQSLLGRKTIPPPDSWSPSKSVSLLPQCQLCACSFDTSDALSDHNETVHSVFTCLCCFKTFTSRSNLERHSRLHTGHRPYACDVCGKSFSRKDHLSNHAAKHAFKCSACSQRCADRDALVSHFLYDHGAVMTDVCSFCNKGFCSAELYEEHLKSHPQSNACDSELNSESTGSQTAARSSSKERFSCTHCSFETNDKVSLTKHRLVHSAERRSYACKGCGKIYEDPLQYSDHLILHQKDRDVFECCICRQVCGTLSSLRRHEAAHVSSDNSDMEIVAEDDDCFRCGECNRTFETLQILQEHMDVHALAKRHHSCRSCQKTFVSQIDLESHVSAVDCRCRMPKEVSGCVENCFGAADGTSRRDKRKQKQPKLVMNTSGEIDGTGESDVEVAEPRSPGVGDDQKSGGFDIADNFSRVVQESADVEIKTERFKSILSRMTASALAKPLGDRIKFEDQDIMSLLSVKLEGSDDAIERPVDRGNLEGPIRPTPKRRGRGRGRHRSADKSGRLSALLDRCISPSPGADMLMNNNLVSGGPFVCAVCSFEADTFPLLDNHCVTLHSRSPCMFCSKTFAQKANRDRHHCLHTGDKPYGCPECDEKFSRGDKLKMHRVRAHGVQYPLYGSCHKESSSRDREFTESPLGFLALHPDVYSSVPSACLTGLPALDMCKSQDPENFANLKKSSVTAKGDVDGVGDHVSEIPKINSNFLKHRRIERIEKETDLQMEKIQTNDAGIEIENNVHESVSAGN